MDAPFPFLETEVPGQTFVFWVENKRFFRVKTHVCKNCFLNLDANHAGAFTYLLGNRIACKWIKVQFRVGIDKHPGNVNDSKPADHPNCTLDFIGPVVTTCPESVKIVEVVPDWREPE